MALSAEDYFAIQNLIHTYPYLLDSGDFDGLGRFFARCRIYSSGQLASDCNAETAAAMFRDWLYLYDGVPRTRHYLSNLIIEPQSDSRAIVRTYVTVHQQTDALPLQPIIGGDYQDTVEKIDGQWRLVERRMANDLIGNLSVHGHDAGVITPMRANKIDYR